MADKKIGDEKEMHIGCLHFKEQSSYSSTLDESSEAGIIMKGDKLIISYDDAGTVKYRYLDLTSTNATWVYTTTAPQLEIDNPK